MSNAPIKLPPQKAKATKRESNNNGPTLMEYVERYILARDLSPEYANKVRVSNRRFCEWCGRTVRIGELNCDEANKWLADMQAAGTNPRTIYGHRASLLAVWREAYMDSANDNPPLRLRRIKKPRLAIECFTHKEIQQLLRAAAKLPGYYRNGVKVCEFWQAAIHAGYSTGLRRGDLLAVKRSQIREDGTAVIVQSKTGYPVAVQFSDEAMEFIRQFDAKGMALPWAYKAMTFSRAFNRLRHDAGVERGSFKWCRRAGASYAERDRPGDGSRLLGHRCESVFRSHYEDTNITTTVAVKPPKIAS